MGNKSQNADTSNNSSKQMIAGFERQILEATPSGMILVDAQADDMPIVYVNAAFERMTGYSRNEAIGHNCRFLQGNDRDQLNLDILRDAIKNKQACTVTLRNYRKDGTPFWNELRISPIFDPDGDVKHFVGIQNDVTQREEALDQLKVTSANLRAMLDSTKQAITLIDTNARIVDFDKRGAQITKDIFGKPLRKGEDIYDYILERDLESFTTNYNRALAGETVTVESEFNGQDTTAIQYFEFTYYPVTDIQDTILGVCMSAENITERKQMEDSLHESEKLYRNLFENTMHEVHLWKLVRDEQGAIKTWQLVEANPTTLKAWGKTRPDIIGKTTDEIFLYNATEQFMPIVKKIFSEGMPYTWEAYFPPTDEFLYMTSVPFGEYFISTGTDITELKKAELEAIRERNLLRTIIDNIPDYIFVKDSEGRFIETNTAHATAANLTREEMLNRHANDVYEPELAQQFYSDDDLVLKTGQSIINEERLSIGANNDEKWVLTTKVPLRDPESNIIGLIGISRDITHRRQVEQQRLEAERLRVEIEQEREYIDLKQRFINTASHNLRTPLAIIRSSTSILQRYAEQLSPDDKQVKYAQIQSQIDQMTRLLDDVLRIGKINSGKLEVEYTTFNLKPSCERLWNDFLVLDENKHPVEFLYEATIETITADEQLLQHAVMNLLSNAFKYTPADKKIQFHISNNDYWIKIRVQDEGIGIPESDIKHLFQPFTRAGNTENIKGTGLGLVITKEYIELHGGSIVVDSEENKGTTFTIQLPIHKLKPTA